LLKSLQSENEALRKKLEKKSDEESDDESDDKKTHSLLNTGGHEDSTKLVNEIKLLKKVPCFFFFCPLFGYLIGLLSV